MTADEIATQFDRYNICPTIFPMAHRDVGSPNRWSCMVDYKTSANDVVKINRNGATMADAMLAAWTAISDMAQFGFKMPEVLTLPAPQEVAPSDDEIPF